MERKAAQRALADSPDPNARLAIASTSGRYMLDFTDDRAKMNQMIVRIKPSSQSPSAHATCPVELSYYLANQILHQADSDALRLAVYEEADCGSHNPELEARSAAEISISEHEGEIRAGVATLKATVRRLAILPGQRTIVLVSPGFLATPVLSEMTEIIDLANRNGVVIDAIDDRGLYPPTLAESIEDPNSAVAANPEAIRLLERFNRQEQESRSDPLGELANGTGGTFFQNSNDLYAGFQDFTASPDVFYMLGFTPQGLKADGAYHRLNVKITDRKGMEVHARQGYYAPKVISDPAMQAKEEIQNAVFSRDEIQDISTVLTIQPSTGITPAKLAVMAHVDLRSIAFRERNGQAHNSIVATFSLFDGDGNYIHGQQNKIELNYPKEQLAAKVAAGLNLKSEFEVKPGQYLVRLVLRDEAGNMSASSKTIEIAATMNTAWRVDPSFPPH